MPDIAVSVVVPSRRGATRLPTLFRALSTQEFDGAWEAVVVVDGDIDGTSAVVDAAASYLPVRRITFDDNCGRSAALNAGFESAHGRVLVRCDDDLLPSPDYLSRHVRAHAGKRAGVVGLYRNVYPDTAYARIYGRDWDRRFRQEAYQVRADQLWRYWAGNVSVTRETWEEVGPYDTSFRAYGWEDVDWGYRLMSAGIPIMLDPALETEHRIAATTTGSRTQRAFYSGAARNRFERKHGSVVAAGTPTSTWDRLASGIARGLDERRAAALGTSIEAGTRVLPERASRKLIALAIDASSRAGYDAGRTAGAI